MAWAQMDRFKVLGAFKEYHKV